MANCSSPYPRSRLLQRAILCLLTVVFAGYLLYWWFFALDLARMEAVETWGREHGIALDVTIHGGAYASPGLLYPVQVQLDTEAVRLDGAP